MKRKITIWGLIGFIVGNTWLILFAALPPHPLLWVLPRLTCPIVPLGAALHFVIAWYWIPTSNLVVYGLVGLVAETVRLLLHRLHVAEG